MAPRPGALLALLGLAAAARRSGPGAALLDASAGAAFTPQHALGQARGLPADIAAPWAVPPVPFPPPATRLGGVAWPLGDVFEEEDVAGEVDHFGAPAHEAAPEDDTVEPDHRFWLHPREEAAKHPSGQSHSSGTREGGMVVVSVAGELNGMDGWHDILLPQAWAQKLDPTSITVWESEELTYPYFVGHATLANKPSRTVSFAVMPTGDVDTEREIQMAKLMGKTGFAPEFIESKEFKGVTFVLMESPGTEPLSTVIEDREDMSPSLPLLSISECVKIMTTLLQSLKVMERTGVVHGDLTEDHIYLVDGGSHAVITDFRHSCIGGAGSSLSCSVDGSHAAGSAYRQAPETADDHPDSVASNVWQLGLVFARMFFGGEVPTESQIKHAFPFETVDERTVEGRRRIREMVRDAFSVQRATHYEALAAEHGDLMEIVGGMLDTDPATRWNADKALSAIYEVAKKRRMLVPMPREPPKVAEDWMMAAVS